MPDNNFEQNQQQFPPEQQQNPQVQPQQQYAPPVQGQPYQEASQQYNNVSPQYAPAQPIEEKASVGLAILSFFIPLVGIILFFAKKKSKPKTAKACGIAALTSIAICVIMSIVGGKSREDSASSSSDYSSYSSSQNDTDKDEDSESPAVSDEKTVFEVGDVYESRSLRITYVSCDADCQDYDEFWKPDSGNKVVRAEFTFENIGDNDESLSSLDCYADNAACESFYGADDYKSPTLESISKGRMFNAVVYYEVPENAEEIVLEYETSLWSDEYITFVIK